MGLGATKRMVFECIVHLHKKEGEKNPSWRWFTRWLKSISVLHTLKTKPIEQARLDSHSEDEVKDWFQGYQAALKNTKLLKAKIFLTWMNQVSE